jgi:hypothetical protein
MITTIVFFVIKNFNYFYFEEFVPVLIVYYGQKFFSKS